MKFYTNSHEFSCGIDLHSKTMYLCVLNREGKKVLHRNIRNDGEYFLKLMEPFKQDLVVAAESTFNWYWLADVCLEAELPFVLGHALYMKAIHGGKTKNDKIDSEKIALLLRAGMLPSAYVYPRGMRIVRDLMRRRLYFTRKKAEVLVHLEIARMQYNLEPFSGGKKSAAARAAISKAFPEAYLQRSADADIAALENYEKIIKSLEKDVTAAAFVQDEETFQRLMTIPGVGRVLALTIMYEIHTIERFPRVQEFLSYARLVKCEKTSGGKSYGVSGAKIGNAYLKWAFSEAAVHFLGHGGGKAEKYYAKLKRKHKKGKALSVLATRLGRAVYIMLKEKKDFDMEKFLM